jgi:NDP-sugar pyrophosphorylase family protein
LQIMIDRGEDVLCHRLGYWLDLSYPWHLLNANEVLLSTMPATVSGRIEANVTINGAVSIGAGTTVRSGAYIVGPVMIGDNCDIGPNCFIRPYTSVGDRCHIGAAVEVKNSIVMNGSKIPHLNYVGDSVIGEGCNLGAGTKIANLRLDEKEIVVGGSNTGRRKFGAVLGDGVKTGINASINTGTMIGNGSFVGPGAVVSGVVSPDSKVF